MNPELDAEKVRRAWYLNDQALRRFILCSWGNNNQWYWCEVQRVERTAESLILYGAPILFSFPQRLYGVELYDDQGNLIFRGWLEQSQQYAIGQVANLSLSFRGVNG